MDKLEIALNALKNIADPIGYLRKEAQKDGCQLDGRGAVEFANNGISISKIAEDALRIIDQTNDDGWKKYREELPPPGVEVLAYHPDWIDEDFNPTGTRIGFQIEDEDFTSAYWWNYQDCYMTISHGHCDGNPSYSNETKSSIEPELWISLKSLTNLLILNKE